MTGEEIYTKTEFREVFERRAADIINPDVCNCGGILELREIAAMAEPHHVAVSPHNYNSTTVGLAATLQAAAGMPNFLITEYFVNFEDVGRAISRSPLAVENSHIALPVTPGLGIDLDEDALRRYPVPRAIPPRTASTAGRVTARRAHSQGLTLGDRALTIRATHPWRVIADEARGRDQPIVSAATVRAGASSKEEP